MFEARKTGRSWGGRTTKIHAVVDGCGRPIALEMTSGQLGDIGTALSLLGPLAPAHLCAAGTACDNNGLRQFLIERGMQPVISNNPTRKRFHPFDAPAYKRRNLIAHGCELEVNQPAIGINGAPQISPIAIYTQADLAYVPMQICPAQITFCSFRQLQVKFLLPTQPRRSVDLHAPFG